MKKVLVVIAVLAVAGILFAQSDSSFVALYQLNGSVHPIWDSECSGLGAGNVFLDYSGNPVMQSWMLYNTDPPPGSGVLDYVSPFAVFTPAGDYLTTIVSPTSFGNGYTRITPDGEGEYWALRYSIYHPWPIPLHKLDANFDIVESLTLTLDSGADLLIEDFMLFQGGILACGSSTARKVLAMFNLAGEEIWQRSLIANEGKFTLGVSSSGNVYYHQGNGILFTNAAGDSLGYKVINGITLSRIVESNDVYYGVEASNNFLRIYSLGENAHNTEPQGVLAQIPVDFYSFMYEREIPVIKTSDGGFAFLLQSPWGEVAKFDAEMNWLWSSNNLQYEIINHQKHPLMELPNGDILYACGVNDYSWDHEAYYFALTRITAQGVPVDDPSLPQPSLLQLGPNPFHKELTMQYKGSSPGKPIVKVYNLKGQEVQTITLESKLAGWAPNNLAAGVYILKLFEGAKNVATQKITYLK